MYCALQSITSGLDYIFRIRNFFYFTRFCYLLACYILFKIGYLSLDSNESDISLYGDHDILSGLPTMLTLSVHFKAFFVISQIYFLDMFGSLSIEVANRTVAVDAQVRLLCYPRGSFYPLSPVPPTKYTRIT